LNRSEAGRLGGIAAREATKIRSLSKREEYLKNPKRCENCNSIIRFEERLVQRFCSHRCAALKLSALSKVRRGPPRTTPYCVVCDKPHKMSGDRCQTHELDRQVELGFVSTRGTLKKWLIRKRGRTCERCGNTEWFGSLIPLEIDHADGNAGNNKPDNIRLLCPNCHAQMPTSKGKNRGNGRAARGLPKH